MSLSDRVNRLTESLGGNVVRHSDYVRDLAILAGVVETETRSDLPQDVKDALGREDVRRRLVQHGGLAKEGVPHLANADLLQAYSSNRGCLDHIWECCLGSIVVEGTNPHAVMGAKLIVQCYRECPQLGGCPHEILTLAGTEMG